MIGLEMWSDRFGGSALGFCFRAWGLGSRVGGIGFEVKGYRCRLWGKDWASGFHTEG